jgi:hypothetical protein
MKKQRVIIFITMVLVFGLIYYMINQRDSNQPMELVVLNSDWIGEQNLAAKNFVNDSSALLKLMDEGVDILQDSIAVSCDRYGEANVWLYIYDKSVQSASDGLRPRFGQASMRKYVDDHVILMYHFKKAKNSCQLDLVQWWPEESESIFEIMDRYKVIEIKRSYSIHL